MIVYEIHKYNLEIYLQPIVNYLTDMSISLFDARNAENKGLSWDCASHPERIIARLSREKLFLISRFISTLSERVWTAESLRPFLPISSHGVLVTEHDVSIFKLVRLPYL